MTYSEIISLITNKLVGYFDEVYHSAEIITTDANVKFPAITDGDGWLSLVPTDQREIIYIRRNGDDEMISDLGIGGCMVAYKMRTPLRIVYFKDHAQNLDSILSKILIASLVSHTTIRSVIRDKWKLMKEESSGDYNFGATTAYFAVNIYANWQLIPDKCEESDFCITIDNPVKKCITTTFINS